MPGMSIKEFKCDLCDQPFTMSSGDLMVPQPNVCDDCLTEVWDMADEALAAHTAACLARGAGAGQFSVEDIVSYINTNREQWAEVEEVIRLREWARSVLGG
jgi:hypothetical protein